MSPIVSSEVALERLKAGNRRFVDELQEHGSLVGSERRSELRDQQEPFAIILGCSDSRVPSELVFDQGLGDLFVIRVAGNIVAPSQIGSVEFAAKRFGTRLVVVLGHSQCGAVAATIEEMYGEVRYRSPNVLSIVDFIRPAIEPLMLETPEIDRQELLRLGVRANIMAATRMLLDGSKVLEEFVAEKDLQIVGAEYCLDSGVVDFFDADSSPVVGG
jgi:carbonic anhydrase